MRIQRALSILAVFALMCEGRILSQYLETSWPDVSGLPVRRLPDTGQLGNYTATFGEDSDYSINTPSFTVNGDGTVTDNVTGLMWQQSDGGEITFEAALLYCDTLTLGGHADWRLPTSHELFGIINHDRLNPALDTTCFTKSLAEYWWSNDRRAGDSTRVWVANAGGGIGPHPKNETISAGGTKRFHVRGVRELNAAVPLTSRFQDNGDSTVTDRSTGLTWQKTLPVSVMAWEQGLSYCETLSLGGHDDWRLPNIKEIQSLNDENLSNPSVDRSFFPGFVPGKFWSSTTQFTAPTRAWYIDFQYGITTYDVKTIALNVLSVRGGAVAAKDTIEEVLMPGGEYEMGDHFGFVDPSHPSDEVPIHLVKVNALYIGRTETSNQQFLAFLNASLLSGEVEVRNNIVYAAGDSVVYCYTNQYSPYYSIGYDGTVFSIVDFRANHPMVGVMWCGAAAFCDWLSGQYGLQACYNLKTWDCDFTKNGYRLPTEAEWEYAGRGGQYNPYFIYPAGNIVEVTKANLPGSDDPYETGSLPYTTPVGFYDGRLKQKSEFNWPGSATSYQTSDGANAFGLYDMQGNVWEFVNDWYGQNYYSVSPFDNPKGPDSGFIMPDGKPYRGMRGGNWYNGLTTNGINDGHSRVANRNPSYYRGPQDPNHPWYHVGFRVARNSSTPTGLNEAPNAIPKAYQLFQNYPNPFNPTTTISFSVPQVSHVVVRVHNVVGQEVARLVDGVKSPGTYAAVWDGSRVGSGIYFCTLSSGAHHSTVKMILLK